MKFFTNATLLLASFPLLNALSIPQSLTSISRRAFDPESHILEAHFDAPNPDLVKRKGGGGGGARGGSSGGSSSGSSGGGARTGGTAGGAGGRTASGSGVAPAYGGGRYYGGGAAVPYRSGGRTPGGLLPFGLLAGAAIFPGLWLASVYAYNLNSPYRFYNASAGQNQTKPVTCVCAEDEECGCDQNTDPQYIDGLIGNGSYAALDKTLVQVADVNGTSNIVINGTLPNGTTAAGGTDSTSAGTSVKQAVLENSGFWLVGAIVAYTVWFM